MTGLYWPGLTEDYVTWKEGGKSLIDWNSWKPELDQARKNIDDLKANVDKLAKALAHRPD